MKRRSLWLVLGLTAAGLIAAGVLLWAYVLRPPLEVSDLEAGHQVSLRSGLTLTLPPGASGSLSRWRSPDARLNNPLGLADELVLTLPGPDGLQDAASSVFWREDGSASGPLTMLGRQHLLARSAEGSVEVRWSGRKPDPDVYNVFVVTRLPGSRPGVLQLWASDAHDAASAWNAAWAAWRTLGVTGAELPPPSQ